MRHETRDGSLPYAAIVDDPEATAELQRTFGTNFRMRRLAAGMTQSQVATLTGMHRQVVGEIEKGNGNVTLKTMHRLAVVVKCRVEVLLVPANIDGSST